MIFTPCGLKKTLDLNVTTSVSTICLYIIAILPAHIDGSTQPAWDGGPWVQLIPSDF